MDASWTTNSVGLHEALDFLEQWWVVFLLSPFVAGPLLFLISLPSLKKRPHSLQEKKRHRSPSKSRRSLTRRLFIDDSVRIRDKTSDTLPRAQLFTSTFIVAAVISAFIFCVIATILVVRAFLLVNEGHNL